MHSEPILLVDDEEGILMMLESLLRKEGFNRISKACTAAEALKAVQTTSYSLIVLDVTLPDLDGFTLCMELRKITHAPILFLTARSGDIDKLQGLSIGGDDYVTKPFLPLEVVARIRAHLRRETIYSSSVLPSDKVFDYGIFSLNRTTGQLHINHEEVSCPAKEFELLHYFCSHPNRVFTAQQLYELVWGNMVQGDEKTVVIHISRLRRKLETTPSNPRIIVTIRGIGYKFIPPYGE